MTQLEICLLHAVPVIRRDGQPLSLRSRKAEALLLFVFLSGEATYRRDYLASLLWEDRGVTQARDNLRQTLARIKRSCGDLAPALHVGRSHIEVDARAFSVDAADLLHLIETDCAALEPAHLQFDLDDLFSDYDDIGQAFQSWIRIYKSRLEQDLTRALMAALTRHADTPDQAIAAAELLMRLDPTNEAALRFRMRWHAGHGEPAEALRLYNALYELLDAEYDVEPTDETIALNAAVKLGQIRQVPPPPASPPPEVRFAGADLDIPPQIYVTEFDMPGDRPETERLGRFFRAEILGNLSRFREWNVMDIPPNSEDFYQLDCQIEEQQEDIDAILTMRHMPDRRIIWSERFVAGFRNWRRTQWRIAQQLALAVDQSLTTDRLRSTLTERPENRRIFDKWTLCTSLNAEWSPEATRQVIGMLEEITETAPLFGLAHSFLAATHNKMHLVYPGIFRSEASVTAALRHAQLAMTLDPLDSHTHRVLAWAKALNAEYDVAEFHFRRSYELNPANMHVRASCALGLGFLGNSAFACRIADETLTLKVPMHPFHWGYFQNIYFLAGRLDDARAAGDMAGDAISNLPAWQAAILREQGEETRARAAMARFYDLTRLKWHGLERPDRQTMLKWFLHCFPLREDSARERLRDCVADL